MKRVLFCLMETCETMGMQLLNNWSISLSNIYKRVLVGIDDERWMLRKDLVVEFLLTKLTACEGTSALRFREFGLLANVVIHPLACPTIRWTKNSISKQNILCAVSIIIFVTVSCNVLFFWLLYTNIHRI